MYQHQTAAVPMEPVPEALRPLVAAGHGQGPRPTAGQCGPLRRRALREAAWPALRPDWEDRGRSHLGEAALLLAALWPSARRPRPRSRRRAGPPDPRLPGVPAGPQPRPGPRLEHPKARRACAACRACLACRACGAPPTRRAPGASRPGPSRPPDSSAATSEAAAPATGAARTARTARGTASTAGTAAAAGTASAAGAAAAAGAASWTAPGHVAPAPGPQRRVDPAASRDGCGTPYRVIPARVWLLPSSEAPSPPPSCSRRRCRDGVGPDLG